MGIPQKTLELMREVTEYNSWIYRQIRKYVRSPVLEIGAGIGNMTVFLSKKETLCLDVDKENKVAMSWWVSAKRTRSYPYARVYSTLNFSGKKITIIPVVKDEGKQGDRDFLQWDTVSLMSLLGVYRRTKHALPAQNHKPAF